MSGENTARATRTPSHGVGKLVAPFPPGVSGNPGGRPTRFREVREICRNKSAAAAQALIRIVEDVDANGRNVEDGRVVVVAAQTILTWAFGKPPDYDPREDKPPLAINTSVLTVEERRLLLALLRKGLAKEIVADPASESSEQIEGHAKPKYAPIRKTLP